MTEAKSPFKRFFDQSYQGKEKQLKLQLQISPGYIYRTFLDASDNRFVGYEEFYLGEHDRWETAYDDIQAVLRKDKNNYQKVIVGIIEPIFTLIPTSLFTSQSALSYLKLNQELIDEEQLSIHENAIQSLDSTLVFAYPKRIHQLLSQQFAGFQLLHYGSPLLELSGLELSPQSENFKLHIQYDHFEVIYAKNGKLRFFNRFNYQTVEDLIYYLLYVMEQLQLDREKIAVEVFGEFEKQSAIFEMLHKYIRNINIRERNPEMKYSAVLSELPKHYYFNLFNQYLCE
ncbi:MAG: DUF3822 family protein [Vicingaceae bacterium]